MSGKLMNDGRISVCRPGAAFSDHHEDMEPNSSTTMDAAGPGAPGTAPGTNRGEAGRTRNGSRRNDLRPSTARVHAATVLLACALLITVGLFFGGFMAFANVVGRLAAPDGLRADGIVVLTGGADRISGAIDLLTDGRARRLLISGVHPDTSARQIGRVVDAMPSLFDCCVDLDRRAANTIGNAVETAKWVRANRFSSIIVVTSAYHMPRSLAELSFAMPDVDLVPYPVARPTLNLDRWWRNPETVRLLLEEYLKYMATRARLTLDGARGHHSMVASVLH